MTGRALISLKVNDANAMFASFDLCLWTLAGFWPRQVVTFGRVAFR
jgi:hypothetical protein